PCLPGVRLLRHLVVIWRIYRDAHGPAPRGPGRDSRGRRSFLAVDAAVRAAVGAAVGVPQPGSTPHDPHALEWDCGDAAWMALLRPGGERALLAGWHHEFSLTEGSGRDGDAGTDLVGDAPGWWHRGVEHARGHGRYLGFLYGWDGVRWWRLDQPTDDGFDPEFFPVTGYALREI